MGELETNITNLSIQDREELTKKQLGMPLPIRDSITLAKEKHPSLATSKLGAPSTMRDSIEVTRERHPSLILKVDQEIEEGNETSSEATVTSSAEDDNGEIEVDNPENSGFEEEESNSGAQPRRRRQPRKIQVGDVMRDSVFLAKVNKPGMIHETSGKLPKPPRRQRPRKTGVNGGVMRDSVFLTKQHHPDMISNSKSEGKGSHPPMLLTKDSLEVTREHHPEMVHHQK